MQHLLKVFGPGILFASTCIGVSHLVQSTRAGADYGLAFLWAVILANLFKYPFFEFTVRYTNISGKNILHGYNEIGKWAMYLYILLTFVSMFIVTAAVTFVTAGLMANLLNANIPINIWIAVSLTVTILILALGQFSILDNLLKVVASVLLISTLFTFFSVLFQDGDMVAVMDKPVPYSSTGILFLIALMGWMPTAIDLSTWSSLWMEEKIRTSGYYPSLKQSLLDFNIGYLISGVLAVCFLVMGAKIIFPSSEVLSNSSADFASQIVNMYTSVIGQWSYIIIAIAAFTTMFSTSITLIDGYGRSVAHSIEVMSGNPTYTKRLYLVTILILGAGAYVILMNFINSLTAMVDLATTLSFVVAPLAALLNLVVILRAKREMKVPRWLMVLAWLGLAFLTVFTLFFVLIKMYPSLVGQLFLI